MDRFWSYFQSRKSNQPVVEFDRSSSLSLPAKGT